MNTTKRAGMGSHQSANAGKDEWLTPPHIWRALGTFDLDPCAPAFVRDPIARTCYDIKDDGLNARWFGRVWCNPPYGRETGKWLSRCANYQNATALIFARTETEDWVEHVWKRADSLLFIWGRLFFHHVDGTRAKHNGGAPSVLVAYDRLNTMALKHSGIPGQWVKLKSE